MARSSGNSPEVIFGAVLRDLRTRRGISQEQLAALSGYHRTYIGQLERGEKSPSLRTLFAIGPVVHVTPSALLRRVERRLAGLRAGQ